MFALAMAIFGGFHKLQSHRMPCLRDRGFVNILKGFANCNRIVPKFWWQRLCECEDRKFCSLSEQEDKPNCSQLPCQSLKGFMKLESHSLPCLSW